MASVLQVATPDAIRRIRRVQAITIAWMGVEAAVSLLAAWRARSPALLAFGGDSAIELLSAVVVLEKAMAAQDVLRCLNPDLLLVPTSHPATFWLRLGGWSPTTIRARPGARLSRGKVLRLKLLPRLPLQSSP